MSSQKGLFWTGDKLSMVPAQADTALILRHAEREDIPPGTFGVDAPLTACGVASAEKLGAMLADTRPKVRALPVPYPGAHRRPVRYSEAATGPKMLPWTGGLEVLAPLSSMRRPAGRCSWRSAYWRQLGGNSRIQSLPPA